MRTGIPGAVAHTVASAVVLYHISPGFSSRVSRMNSACMIQ